MADEDGGVLGNLPRSRPGRRSEKRTQGTAARAPAKAQRTGTQAASPKRPPETSRGAVPEQPEPSGGDLVGDAVRTVTGVAATGAKVAGGVAREVFRRLPRP